MEDLFVGVDVGTGSARAALVTARGLVLASCSREIQIWSPKPGFAEQSSQNIWDAVCEATREVVKNCDVTKVKGIGFDATCSMVVLDKNGDPVSVSFSGEKDRNIIMWMDHRAENEVELINNTGHRVLDFVGGKISLEMQIPKLLWLKNNFGTDWFKGVGHFFDLPDFLTWKASGSTSRSLCSLVCKWTYQVGENGAGFWARDFFKQIGLGEVLRDEHKIGTDVRMPGSLCGGLTPEAAKQLGLPVGVSVGASLIDAHAGTLGMLGCSAPGTTQDFSARLSLICGTSACHMALSDECLFVDGVWGPYFSAVLPNMWLAEGGQSACGRLVDHIIDSHPASAKFKHLPKNEIAKKLNQLISESKEPHLLTTDLHVVPDFHGNRSPLADATRKGMISGLDLDTSEKSLAALYLATIQAIAYGTRHIFETLQQHGHKLSVALVCGGLGKNELFVQTVADVLEMPVLLPEETESVLLGAAILGATAAGAFPSVQQAAVAMGGKAERIQPNPQNATFHRKKYKVFMKMLADQSAYREIMASK